MQKILKIDLEKRKALENLKNLGIVSLGGIMLSNLNMENVLNYDKELSFHNAYTKYLNLNLNAFYIPDTLLHLLELDRTSKDAFCINVLINSSTAYKNPLLQYAITQKQPDENIVYSLMNHPRFNHAFDSLNSLKLALEKKNFYLNFLDLDNENSLLNFYNILLKDENLKKYFYLKNGKFYIDEKISKAIKINQMNLTPSLELYLRLINDFQVLNKFEIINILEKLAQENIKTLYFSQNLEDKTKVNEKYFLSNVVMNLRVK